MTGELFDWFRHVEVAAPTVPVDEVRRLVADEFGMDAEPEAWGSQQDQNLLLRRPGGGAPIGVLKISNPVVSAAEIDLQDRAAARVAERAPGLRVPRLVVGPRGPARGRWRTSQGEFDARVIEFVAGATLMGSDYLSPRTAARIGGLAAEVSLALAGLDDPAAARIHQWDPQHALRVIETLLPDETDAGIRAEVERARDTAAARLSPIADLLPRQLAHLDVTDDNVLAPAGPIRLPDAVIDFGDVTATWAVGELAHPIASLLHHDGMTVPGVLPTVRAFHARRPLSSEEADALWPLVVLRGAVLVLSGRQQVRVDDDNRYASTALDRELRILRQAVSEPLDVVTALVRSALGLPVARPTWRGPAALALPEPVVVLDAGTTAPLNDEGRWADADAIEAGAFRLLDAGAGAVVLPAFAPVLTGARALSASEPASVPLASMLWVAGDLRRPAAEDLVHDGVRVGISGVGEVIAARTATRVTVTRDGTARSGGPDLPERVTARMAPGWRAIAGDPAPALGLAPAPTDPDDLLRRREAVVAEPQEHYYADPPEIERGWREHLIDTDGRVYLDMVNNIASIGHAHPRLVAAAGRQLRLLNTNSRFNYRAIVEYGERLAATLPDELDTVFFVNSGSESVDLALRLAMAATGRPDAIAMREAYHGWTYASDAISTSVADNPNALATRPGWVHTVDAANGYRGTHRGADAARYAPEAVERIRELAAEGRPPAAFICESFFGNAGGVALPDGYLREVYAAVRAEGGLAISDEVQVGFGRLGDWFWGFEQQGVVPDIVAVAKSIGAGHPIGVVVTRREIADRYRTGGYFFSSTGGSPVSSVVGMTVLDVIRDERLQENARDTGAHLKARLEELGERHPLVGAVHGAGLYLGVEFVRDRATLEPATEETAAICDRLLELGVIMQPTGDHQNVLKIKPPLVVSRASVDFFADALDRVLTTGW
ncbi:aminotransferase [Pseudolysinimonas sp.]|uniref:aminotransferase n=1 Tax=Pseudolysinimonas sp. TaxID=2680009 RepID=UPI003F815CA1